MKKKKLILTGEIWQEGEMYTSYCPELDVASCGYTEEEARRSLLEVIEILIEETSKMGTLQEILGVSLNFPLRRRKTSGGYTYV